MPFSSATITLTDAAPRLTGRVTEDRTPPGPVAVLVFPVERDQWMDYGLLPDRIAAVLAQHGEYRLPPIPAGAYYVIAVPADRIDAWRDPDFLARASGVATLVRLDWGVTTTQDLKVIDVH